MSGPSEQLQALVERDLAKQSQGLTVALTLASEHGPNPRQRICPNCEQLVTLGDDWVCPTPGCLRPGGKPMLVLYGLGVVNCPNEGCNRKRKVMYYRNKVNWANCPCEMTEDERRRQEAERERKAQDAAKMGQRFLDARTARDCWKSLDYRCEISQLLPHCHACGRFPAGAKLQGELRAHERDQRSR